MSRMLDLIRTSALTSHQMLSASKGALRVPAEEMLEILVYLAEHNKIYADTARLTLAAWDEASAVSVSSSPAAPKDVLKYWLQPNNIRPALFPSLIENPCVEMETLAHVAGAVKGDLIETLLASPRVRGSKQLLQELATNHKLTGQQAARVQALIAGEPEASAGVPVEVAAAQMPDSPVPNEIQSSVGPCSAPDLNASPESTPADPETEQAIKNFCTEHATEIAADANKPFQPIGGIHEEETPPEQAQAAAAGSVATPSVVAAPHHVAHPMPVEERRGSVLQKIAKLDIKGRIHLAMRGNKEERSILVRDGTKIVAIAVLDSPKITDGEVEKVAGQKNVLEAVLRAIPMRRRYAKNYAIMRNLVFNPRTPLDVSLGLMKNMLVADLRNLSTNKEISETIRKLALRMFKQKSEPAKKN